MNTEAIKNKSFCCKAGIVAILILVIEVAIGTYAFLYKPVSQTVVKDANTGQLCTTIIGTKSSSVYCKGGK